MALSLLGRQVYSGQHEADERVGSVSKRKAEALCKCLISIWQRFPTNLTSECYNQSDRARVFLLAHVGTLPPVSVSSQLGPICVCVWSHWQEPCWEILTARRSQQGPWGAGGRGDLSFLCLSFNEHIWALRATEDLPSFKRSLRWQFCQDDHLWAQYTSSLRVVKTSYFFRQAFP